MVVQHQRDIFSLFIIEDWKLRVNIFVGYFVSKLKEFKLLVCWDLQTEGLIIIITGKNNTIIRELHEWHVRRKRVFFCLFFYVLPFGVSSSVDRHLKLKPLGCCRCSWTAVNHVRRKTVLKVLHVVTESEGEWGTCGVLSGWVNIMYLFFPPWSHLFSHLQAIVQWDIIYSTETQMVLVFSHLLYSMLTMTFVGSAALTVNLTDVLGSVCSPSMSLSDCNKKMFY